MRSDKLPKQYNSLMLFGRNNSYYQYNMKKFIIYALSIIFIGLPCFAQSNAVMLGKRVTLESTHLSEARQLQILLPENYQAHPLATYPVIYLIDGDYNFTAIAGMLDMLANKGQRIPDVILVGVADKGTDAYHQNTTPNDYSTPRDKNIKGQASQFLAFLTDEVKPYIEKNYRTAPHTSLVGQSMGGLFVLNSLIEKPTAFSHYIAISPSVWLADHAIVEKATKHLSISNDKPVSLFLALGDETRMGQYGFIHYLDVNQPKNLNWSFKHYSDESHNSVGLIALRDSLKAVFNAWYIPEKAFAKFNSPNEIVSHYQAAMDTFSLSQSLPSASIKAIVRQHYQQKLTAQLPQFITDTALMMPASKQGLIAMQASYAGHFDSQESALALLKNVEVEFKSSIEHIKSIAATYESLGQVDTAHHYYQRALVVAMQQKAQQWQLNIIQAKINATDQ